MTEQVENDMNLDMFSKLSVKNDSEYMTHASTKMSEKEAFIEKCIHPPSAIPKYCGLPTNDARSQVCVEWRNVMLSNGCFTQVGAAVSITELRPPARVYIFPTGARINSVEFYSSNQSAPNEWYQNFDGVDLNEAYDFSNWWNDANLHRLAYKSTTISLNATAFNDTGIVTSSQFNPPILFYGTLLTMATDNFGLFRNFIQCMVKQQRYNVYPLKHKDRLLYEGAYSLLPRHVREDINDMFNEEVVLDLDPNTSAQIVNFSGADYRFNVNALVGSRNQFPTQQILQSSMRSTSTMAKEGAFVVQRLNTISPRWQANNTRGQPPTNPLPGLYECYIATAALDSSIYLIQPFKESFNGIMKDTQWSQDMTWAMVKFEGLTYQLTADANVNTQLLIRKTYVGMEIQPAPRSAWTGMMKLGPAPSLGSMQKLMDLNYDLKDVLPAKYNFLGVLGKAAIETAGIVGKSVLSHVVTELAKPQRPSKPSVKAIKKVVEAEEEAEIVEEIVEKEKPKKLTILRNGPGKKVTIKASGKNRNRRRSFSRTRTPSRRRSSNRSKSRKRSVSVRRRK